MDMLNSLGNYEARFTAVCQRQELGARGRVADIQTLQIASSWLSKVQMRQFCGGRGCGGCRGQLVYKFTQKGALHHFAHTCWCRQRSSVGLSTITGQPTSVINYNLNYFFFFKVKTSKIANCVITNLSSNLSSTHSLYVSRIRTHFQCLTLLRFMLISVTA